MVKCTGRGLVVKRPGVLSKVQMLNLVLGVGVFSLLPILGHFAVHFLRVSGIQGSVRGRQDCSSMSWLKHLVHRVPLNTLKLAVVC